MINIFISFINESFYQYFNQGLRERFESEISEADLIVFLSFSILYYLLAFARSRFLHLSLLYLYIYFCAIIKYRKILLSRIVQSK